MVHGTAHPQRETKCSDLHQSGEQLHGPNAITYNCEGTLVRNEAFQGSFSLQYLLFLNIVEL